MGYLHSSAYRSRKVEARARREALAHYGSVCACCGEEDADFLTFDHIHGGGNAHRKTLGGYKTKMARWLNKHNFPDGYRVLCYNCNTAMGLRGYCPHERDRLHNGGELLFVRRHPEAQMPTTSYEGDAGYDLYTSQAVTIPPGGFADVPTGVAVALPSGVWGEIKGRSSTWRKKNISVITGVIDNGWRGELFAGAYNPGASEVTVDVGERIAQLIPHKLVVLSITEVAELPDSHRGENGFGSSGR